MTDFDITKISDHDLCEAGRRLQKAHDYIETHHFRIQNYNPTGTNKSCCYIGTVKFVGGEDCGARKTPPSTVAAALELMDKVALGRGAMAGWKYGRDYPGGAVEGWGLETGSELHDPDEEYKSDSEQAEVALPVFRQAIREVQNEIERRAN